MRYIRDMDAHAPFRIALWPTIIAVAVIALATGAAFAGWANHGADMLVSLAASGLAWCL